MPIDRSKQFHKRRSDVLMQIQSANKRFEEAPDAEIVQALKENSETKEAPIIKAPPAKPQIKPEKKEKPKKAPAEKRDKRVTLYLTEEEYDMFREQAFRRRKKLNEVIVTAAKKNIGRMPNAPKKYTEETEIEEDEE